PICRKTLGELSVSDFAAYRDLRLRSVKSSTLRRELGIIRHLFDVAVREWRIMNPPQSGGGVAIQTDRRTSREAASRTGTAMAARGGPAMQKSIPSSCHQVRGGDGAKTDGTATCTVARLRCCARLLVH